HAIVQNAPRIRELVAVLPRDPRHLEVAMRFLPPDSEYRHLFRPSNGSRRDESAYHLSVADAFQAFEVVRVDGRRPECAVDHVAAEQPLEVRLEGHPFSVIMRTPGADEDLALGFLFSESVILRAEDVRWVESTD